MAALDQRAAVDRFNAVLVDKGGLDRFEQLGLVALDYQQVVALLRSNLFGNAFLAAHGVDRDQQVLDRERLKRLGNRRCFITRYGDLFMAKEEPRFGGEGADHVDRALAIGARGGHRLAVHGDRAAQSGIVSMRAHDAAAPAPEHVLEIPRIGRAQDPQEGFLGRDAVLEYEEATQPRLLGARPEGDVLDRVAVREHGGDQDHQDLPEVVQGAVARLARIIDFFQIAHQGTPLRRTHALRPKGKGRCDFRRAHKNYVQRIASERLFSVGYAIRGNAFRVRRPRSMVAGADCESFRVVSLLMLSKAKNAPHMKINHLRASWRYRCKV